MSGKYLSTEDGAPDLNIAQLHGVHLIRVLVEDGKIGMLADLDTAKLMITTKNMGSIDRDRSHRPIDADALTRGLLGHIIKG